MDIKVGDRVRVVGTSLAGSVIKETDDGAFLVSLDNGMEMKAQPRHIALQVDRASDLTHGPSGYFKKGHPQFARKKKQNKVRMCRENIVNQLEPFFNNLGTLIQQIDNPADQILAMSRIMPYAFPKLATVEFREKQERNLTAEQKIAQLNAAYNHLPDPTKEDGEEEE